MNKELRTRIVSLKTNMRSVILASRTLFKTAVAASYQPLYENDFPVNFKKKKKAMTEEA